MTFDLFRKNILSALANPILQAALDGNYEKRLEAREQAFATLPDANELRERAHAIRAEVIANLDHYLNLFISNVQANGIVVHQAKDATQAVQIVVDIALQKQARLIAKSKSMMSEEINLNPALERAGIKVVETDLGEYIVQLRGERPGHLITPAVHLRRQEVGQTFHEKLGLPLTEDVPTMTSAARQILREVFLNADIGISGVNLGVVETGSLCVLTNEGNGRMVYTLPPIHIALMGLERLVPTLDDLAVILEVLPRASTGQKLTVYVSLINHPRRPDETDGSSERHLILIDNGRRLIQKSPLAEALFCVRCGACLNTCPVSREIGGHAYYTGQHGASGVYAGPIGSVLSPALWGQDKFGHLARASSLCGACKDSCPVDIDLPKLLLQVRAGGMNPTSDKHVQASRSLKLGLSLFTWAATHPGYFSLAQKLAALGSRIISPFDNWLRLPAFTGWGYSKDLPRPARQSFQDRWKKRQSSNKATDQSNYQPIEPGAKEQVSSVDTGKEVPHKNTESLIARFKEELITLGGTVTVCGEDNLPDQLINFLLEREINSILAWEAANLPSGLLETIISAGIQVAHQPQANIQVGLTGAVAACSESGTILLAAGPGRPLTASLLPALHIAILRASDIYENLAKVVNLDEVRNASALALISGPSRTADIEMTLTIGMHGPKEVHVFCIA